ncbi:hypothetical protein ASPZODRAFT_140213 [Penicilliopsis zonata CBS 506.65]|uniref:Mannosyltransferase n=1 Tax=Penicilliopsis zonata CBS 506.65 TaxID=1073090 RepID=A0A1L9SPX0_9EURO|nr:hypothetical protein ASPZODRAFT_140213 [Penicilliopsis zonata CBS 506.65]OJJ49302.1 hypothetical protein ASPZODRAFT_140213 [Penicilliopsis zonata CBS 506.65]
MRSIPLLLALTAFPALILLHLLAAPYTKVEESFHVQATHDILSYGISGGNTQAYLREHYDHFIFPGAVPRTFVGAVFLALLAKPVIFLTELDQQVLGTPLTQKDNPYDRLCSDLSLSVRGILGMFNAVALMVYASGVQRAYGYTSALWYVAFQASQFHVLFYASRPLSNMFAFGLTTLALRYLLPEQIPAETYKTRCRASLFLLTVAGIIFRSELALLLGAETVVLFATGRISIAREIIPAGALGLLVGLSTTVLVDSFFWQQYPLWPELAAFKFNVLAGQASAWGTHPWHFYFSNALPRLLSNPAAIFLALPWALLHPAMRTSSLFTVLPCLAFVALYSLQPHKEWRFIVYVVPPLTSTAARAAAYLWTRRGKSMLYALVSAGLVLSTLGSLALSTLILLPSSAANYPGGLALRTLHEYANASKGLGNSPASVYLGNLACQTGVTRFNQLPTWRYDKTEDDTQKAEATFWSQFDYALIEPGEESLLLSDTSSWHQIRTIDGFAGLKIVRPGEPVAGTIESGVIRRLLGEDALKAWESASDVLRRVLRGYWVELRMEPRIKIMQR